NHGLVGEGGQQLDLLVGKWFHLGTADRECADGLIFPQQRDGQNRPVADAKRHLGAIREIVERCLNVVDMDRRAIEKGASSNPATFDRPSADIHWNWAVMRFDLEPLVLAQYNNRIIRLTQPSYRFHERVQHYLQIERRAADDLEHVGGGGLLLEGLAQTPLSV